MAAILNLGLGTWDLELGVRSKPDTERRLRYLLFLQPSRSLTR